MDDDGYPTDEELERLEKWPFDDIGGAFAFVKSLWWMPDFGVVEANGILYLATGGWSGNESVIEAMLRNVGISTRWICSSRGGAHEFELSAQHQDRETRFKLERQLIKTTAERDAAVQELKRLQLTWTTARPTVAGWYWWDHGGAKTLRYVHCVTQAVPPILRVECPDGWFEDLDKVDGEWAGPIPLPTEAPGS